MNADARLCCCAKLREVAVARDAEHLEALGLERAGERADAEAARVLRAEVLVDDDDRKAELHARLLQLTPVGVRPRNGKGAGPRSRPDPRRMRAGIVRRPRGGREGFDAAGAPEVPRAWRARNSGARGDAQAFRSTTSSAAGPAEQADAQRRAQAPSPRQVLLRRHDARPARASSRRCRRRRRTSRSISAQQQPTQNTPWSMPIRSASRAGARPCQRDATNPNGAWHCSRQRYLSALNWNAPAAASTPARDDPAVERQPRRARRKRAQRQVGDVRERRRTRARRRGSRRRPASASRPASGRAAVMRRNIASSGQVVGSIIAAIISTQASAWTPAGATTLRHETHARTRAASPHAGCSR